MFAYKYISWRSNLSFLAEILDRFPYFLTFRKTVKQDGRIRPLTMLSACSPPLRASEPIVLLFCNGPFVQVHLPTESYPRHPSSSSSSGVVQSVCVWLCRVAWKRGSPEADERRRVPPQHGAEGLFWRQSVQNRQAAAARQKISREETGHETV